MAPKRKPTDTNVAAETRVTRKSPRFANTTPTPPTAVEEPPKTKKAKAAVKPKPLPVPAEEETEVADWSKTIIIEHCKQCNSFKTRAFQVKDGLEKGVEGVNVLVNPEKPRRGCFEIREEGGEIFVSLLDLKRPFKAMKDLDMEEVISEIVEKIK